MRKLIIPVGLLILSSTLWAAEGVQIIRVLLEKRPYAMVDISVTVKNIAEQEIDELSGYVDIYDQNEQVFKKVEMTLLYDADLPLKPGNTVRRKKVIDYQPAMAGTARLRITHLRFSGEKTIYMVCPQCNNLIIKE